MACRVRRREVRGLGFFRGLGFWWFLGFLGFRVLVFFWGSRGLGV